MSSTEGSTLASFTTPGGTRITPSSLVDHLDRTSMHHAFLPWWTQLLIALREKRQSIRTPTRHKIRRGDWRWRR